MQIASEGLATPLSKMLGDSKHQDCNKIAPPKTHLRNQAGAEEIHQGNPSAAQHENNNRLFSPHPLPPLRRPLRAFAPLRPLRFLFALASTYARTTWVKFTSLFILNR